MILKVVNRPWWTRLQRNRSVAQKIATYLGREVRFFEEKELEFVATEGDVDDKLIGHLKVKTGILVEKIPE